MPPSSRRVFAEQCIGQKQITHVVKKIGLQARKLTKIYINTSPGFRFQSLAAEEWSYGSCHRRRHCPASKVLGPTIGSYPAISRLEPSNQNTRRLDVILSQSPIDHAPLSSRRLTTFAVIGRTCFTSASCTPGAESAHASSTTVTT